MKTYSICYHSSQEEKRDQPLLIGYPDAHAAAGMLGLALPADHKMAEVIGSIAISALTGERDGRWTSFSLHKPRYTGLGRYHRALTYSYVRSAVLGLERQGLIEVERGRSWAEGGRGFQSRFRASDLLIERLLSFQIGGIRAPVLREPLRLVGADGGLCDYRETASTRKLRQQIVDFNSFIAAQRIAVTDESVVDLGGVLSVPARDGAAIDRFEIPTSTALFRQFNENWNHHGRFYGGYWQNLPKAIRRSITINGSPVQSADFGNSHARIAYGEIGADPGLTDAYVINGHEHKRDIVKVATNIAINVSSRGEAIDTVAYEIAKREHFAEFGTEDGVKVGPFDMRSADSLVALIEKRHRPIAGCFFTGAGLRFMAIESHVIGRVMAKAVKAGIPVLPVHDEIIMPIAYRDTIVGWMDEAWVVRAKVPAMIR